MILYRLLRRGHLLCLCVLIAAPCLADTITLTLDNVTVGT